MKKPLHYLRYPVLLLLLNVMHLNVAAQYYFKDILSLKQTNRHFQVLKKQKIAKVSIRSVAGTQTEEAEGENWQKISYQPDRMLTYTKAIATGESFFYSFFNNGLLTTTTDSTIMSVSETMYAYNAQNLVVNITTQSRGDGISSKEVHVWTYDSNGKPAKMLRIRNNTDTTFIHFILDESGNVVEEHAVLKQQPLPVIYYYYDEINRLTDIVRYNVRVKKLLPEYIFEYEDEKVSSATIIPEGSNDYQKWYYSYNDDFKIAEFCYDKKNTLLGKVTYQYEK